MLQRDGTVLEAAKIMRQHRFRDVQVIENRDGEMVAVGIITDHGLVVEIMAPELDYMVITVGDIMAQALVTAKGSTGIFEATQYMR